MYSSQFISSSDQQATEKFDKQVRDKGLGNVEQLYGQKGQLQNIKAMGVET
jgi:hypothetical protein